MANVNEIPANAEKVLFAVDVVTFFLNSRYPPLSPDFKKQEIVDVAGTYREFIHKRFSENIKQLIASIDDTQSVLVRREFLQMKNQEEVNAASLVAYNSTFRNTYFASGFQAKSFLMYCSRVALMTCYFFSTGMSDVLDIAIDLIVSEFPEDQNLSCTVWDSLDEAAAEHAAAESLASKTSISIWREYRDIVSSENEDSMSSTINSESDSAAEPQNVPSISETLCAQSLGGGMEKLAFLSVEPSNPVSGSSSSVSTQTEECSSLPHGRSRVPVIMPAVVAKDWSQTTSGSHLEVDSSPEKASRQTVDEVPSHRSSLGKRTSPRKDREESDIDDGAEALEAVPARAIISTRGVKKQRLSESSEKSE